MPNTSASGGYLVPATTPAPLEGNALVDFLQAWVVGVTGLSGANVRPLWQPEPPNIPSETTDWLAFGIVRRTPDDYVAEIHHATGNGYDELRRHEILHLRASFYGPNADNYASILRDGMQVSQNHEVLSANSMGFVESGEPVTVPELLKEKWLYRVDLPFSIKRQIVRQYGVENILTANGTLNNEVYTEQIVN
jgi:hypothetical protein